MGIVYAAKYLNAPDEHCYYDASLNTPLPISGGNLKAVDQADKLYLILKLGMILHAYGLVSGISCMFGVHATNKAYRIITLGGMGVFICAMILYFAWMIRTRFSNTMSVCCGDFSSSCKG